MKRGKSCPIHILAVTSTAWTGVGGTTATFVNGWTLGSFQYSAIANAASNDTLAVESSFGAGLSSTTPVAAAYATMTTPATGANFDLTPPGVCAYPALGISTVEACAMVSGTSTLTLTNPGVTGMLLM